MFVDLVHLVLATTWCNFNSQFYQQTDGVTMEDPATLTTAEIYMHAFERTAISTALHPPKVLKRFFDDAFGKIFPSSTVKSLHQNIKFPMEEESHGQLASLDILLKRNNGE